MISTQAAGKSPFGFESKIVEYLGRMVDASLDFRASAPDAKIHDLKMTDLVADPIANVREIYAFAGKDLSDATVAKMQAYLDANKRDGRAGHHKYDCRDFGLEKDAINARFAAYKARFDL